MRQRSAKGLHIALSVLGAGLYFLFVIPRWWVLIGDIPATLGTVGRIAAGFPVAAAAVPVMLTLRQSLNPELKTPELALRLRAWSAVLHVVAGGLLIVAAVVEIWLPLDTAGPWLFAVYGAAGSIAVLAIAAFYLSFVAEQPPKPAKPAKPKKVKAEKVKAEKAPRRRRLGRKSDTAAADESPSDGEPPADLVDPDSEPSTEVGDDAPESGAAAAEETSAEEPAPAETDADETDDGTDAPAETDDGTDTTTEIEPNGRPGGGLKNIRPTGKRRHRLRG